MLQSASTTETQIQFVTGQEANLLLQQVITEALLAQ